MIGRVLAGRYAIEARHATEILGDVYGARDQQTGASVRVKVLRPDLGEDARRFERFGREISASWLVAHPATLEVVDWGMVDGVRYLVTEAFDGADLWSWCRLHPAGAEEAAEIGAQVASALIAAHSEGVLHRALTPTNVLVARDEQGDWRVKVRDFGMAELEGADADPHDTTTVNARLEEIRFLAPEVLDGDGATRASDLYALGALLHLMVEGRPPDMPKHDGDPAPQLAGQPRWFTVLVADLLSPEPGRRPGAHTALRRLESGVGRRLTLPSRQAMAPVDQEDPASGSSRTGLLAALVAGVGCLGVSGVMALTGVLVVLIARAG